MRILLAVVAIISLLISCKPVDRDYGDQAPPSPAEMFAPPGATILVTGAPTIGPKEPPAPSTCDCEPPPSCGGVPLVTGGDTGCTPTIGSIDMGSVEVRMPLGESFDVWAGDKWLTNVVNDGNETSLSVFGIVSADAYRTGPSPLMYGPVLAVTGEYTTVRFAPSDGVDNTVVLPRAALFPGRRFTVKIVGGGNATVVFQPIFDEFTQLADTIDGMANLSLEGGHPAVTLEAHGDSDGAGPDVAGWDLIWP